VSNTFAQEKFWEDARQSDVATFYAVCLLTKLISIELKEGA